MGRHVVSDEELILKCRDDDQDAWATLLKRHEGALYKVSLKHAHRRGIDVDDCMSHAYEAFTKAVRQFDLERGIKFVTYLWRAAEHAMATVDPGGALYVPHAAIKSETTADAARAARSVSSIDAPVSEDDDASRAHLLVSASADPSAEVIKEENVAMLNGLLGLLDERQRQVLEMRMNGVILEEIGVAMGVSKARVGQIETKAMDVLKALARGKVRGRLRNDRRRWSDIEVSYLRRRVSEGNTIKSCAEELGRSLGGTYRIAQSRQHIVRPNVWTEQHDQFLRENRNKGWQWCAKALGRTATSIHNRVRRLGIANEVLDPIDRNVFLKLYEDGLTDNRIAAVIGGTDERVRVLRQKLGLPFNQRPDEESRVFKMKRTMKRRHGTDCPVTISQKNRAAALGYKDWPLGAAVVATALKRLGSADRDALGNEMRVIADENRWRKSPRGWQQALKFAKWLCDHGYATCRGVGNQRRIYSLVNTGDDNGPDKP